MRVSLVFPPFVDDNYYVTPPLGLMIIAACLEREGHEVRIHDQIFGLRRGQFDVEGAGLYEACARQIVAFRPDIVGFSTQCATYPPTLNVSRWVRDLAPGAFIVFGGHNASFLDEVTLQRFGWVDAVVRGEGEWTAVDLAAALGSGRGLDTVMGLTYRDTDGTIRPNPDRPLIDDLDCLPFPAYHLVPGLTEYGALGDRATALVDSGRGCSFNCIYCSNCRLWEHRVRYRSTRSVVREIGVLVDMGVDEVYLVHDFLTADRAKVTEFCHLLLQSGVKVEWQCRCRIGGMDREILDLMRAAGCSRLLYGVESGSRRTLSFIRKKVDPGGVFQVIQDTVAADIRPSLSFVLGFPHETRDDVEQTLRQILRCQMLGRGFPFINLLSPLPGTDLADRYLDRLVLAAPTAFGTGLEFQGTDRLPEDEQLITQHPDVFSSFYNITGDHLPVELNGDLASLFCPLTETFPFSFSLLAAAMNCGLLALFERWLEWSRTEGLLTGGARLVTRDMTTSSFSLFARWALARLSDAPAFVADIIDYETTIARLYAEEPDRVALRVTPPASLAGKVRRSGRVQYLWPSTHLKTVLAAILDHEMSAAESNIPGLPTIPPTRAGVVAIALVETGHKLWDLRVMNLTDHGMQLVEAAGDGVAIEDLAARFGLTADNEEFLDAVGKFLASGLLEPATGGDAGE